jgi:hypothetical protein
MVREPDATMQPTPQDIQLMSKHRVLSFKPQLPQNGLVGRKSSGGSLPARWQTSSRSEAAFFAIGWRRHPDR